MSDPRLTAAQVETFLQSERDRELRNAKICDTMDDQREKGATAHRERAAMFAKLIDAIHALKAELAAKAEEKALISRNTARAYGQYERELAEARAEMARLTKELDATNIVVGQLSRKLPQEQLIGILEDWRGANEDWRKEKG